MVFTKQTLCPLLLSDGSATLLLDGFHQICYRSCSDWEMFAFLIQNAMQIVGFMEDEVQSVLELVAAVLKLGNLEFKPESRVNGFDESRVKDKNGGHLTQ